MIFEHAERKPLTDDLRNRLSARAAVLRLEGLTAYFGSLARDPLHPSVYYLAVDGAESAPLLLHIALASAPTSSVFSKPLLIGRTRRMNGPEFVVNAIPFGPGDRENVERFAAKIDSSLLPRPQGSRGSITIGSGYPEAFRFFRAVQKRLNRNIAAVAGDYHACLWAAIRAGWRSEYSVVSAGGPESAGLGYTRFAVDATGDRFERAEQEHERIRQARAQQKVRGDFEFEVELGDVAEAGLDAALCRLKERGHAAQFAGVGTTAPETLAEVARRHKVTLGFRYRGESGGMIEHIARVTAGRVNYYVDTPADAETVAEHLLG